MGISKDVSILRQLLCYFTLVFPLASLSFGANDNCSGFMPDEYQKLAFELHVRNFLNTYGENTVIHDYLTEVRTRQGPLRDYTADQLQSRFNESNINLRELGLNRLQNELNSRPSKFR